MVKMVKDNEKTNHLLTTGTSNHCFLNKENNRLLQLKRSHPEMHQIFLEAFEQQKGHADD